MSLDAITIVGSIGGLIATIIACILIIPESKLETLNNPFLVFLHNLFNFKSLWIEKILKFVYTFATLSSVVTGFFMLFWVEEYHSYYYTETEWMGYYGLIVMIVAPIVIRIVYELLMMTILLVKNTIEINNKLGNKSSEPAHKEEFKAPKPSFCPKCGNPISDGSKFCPKCGNHLG